MIHAAVSILYINLKRINMKVILRTHGGLGNQLFQVLYGRLLAAKKNARLVCIHDLNYQHNFELCNELNMNIIDVNWFDRFVSASRIPKIISRCGLGESGRFSLPKHIFLDSYFQDVLLFESFSASEIRQQLVNFRDELSVSGSKNNEVLVHFRLGDFFNDETKVIEHVKSRLDNIDIGAAIITNQEEVFQLPDIQQLLIEKSCKFHSTLNFDAVDVLRLMTSYKEIKANDSTMVFWASVLGGADADFSHPPLVKLLTFFKKLNYCG
jgi:hypothetical protein